MAEYSLTTPTLVAEGSAVPYNNVIVPSCAYIRHRPGTGAVKVRGGGCCHPNKYEINFHGNVTGVAGTIQLGIFVDGELLPETLMSVVLAAATNVVSVDATTEILAESNSVISVRVIDGDPVTVNTANIVVHKEAA